MTMTERLDDWVKPTGGVAALIITEQLMPVEGRDGVLFPPTFAPGDGFKGGYNIDHFGEQPSGKPNVCLVDSVGSQANRMETIFTDAPYQDLVPQVTIVAGDDHINLLSVGHRAGDALVRCSGLREEVQDAFVAAIRGDAEPLAKVAPTSLVFGVWDSRNTQAKLNRLIASTVRAYDVRELSRSAVYTPPVDYAALDVFSEAEKDRAENNNKNPLAQRGFVHNPASAAPGGVIADGGVRRTATLSLAALHLLSADGDEATLKLRCYILGLSLVALTAETNSHLRQGCNLVPDVEHPRSFELVRRNGERTECSLTHEDAIEFARQAAKDFGVGEDREVMFDKKLAKADVAKKK